MFYELSMTNEGWGNTLLLTSDVSAERPFLNSSLHPHHTLHMSRESVKRESTSSTRKRFSSSPVIRDSTCPSTSTNTLHSLLEKRADLNLEGKVHKEKVEKSHGGYSDVYIGQYTRDDGTVCKVAVKKFRAHIMEDRKLQKTLAKELYIWSKLVHPRILPLEGFYVEDENEGYPYLISRWMDNGTALRYLEAHPDADVLSLIIGIAEGVHYLHSNEIVHSDIKPENVLISDHGEPLLCDFGVSRMLAASQSFQLSATLTTGVRGTARYMSKEILKPVDEEISAYSKGSDVWAFGMTVLALLTRKLPYHDISSDVSVIFAIVDGQLPSWPMASQRQPAPYLILRHICEFCWDEKSMRQPISAVLAELHHLRDTLRRYSSRFVSSRYKFRFLRRLGLLDLMNEPVAINETVPRAYLAPFSRAAATESSDELRLPPLRLMENSSFASNAPESQVILPDSRSSISKHEDVPQQTIDSTSSSQEEYEKELQDMTRLVEESETTNALPPAKYDTRRAGIIGVPHEWEQILENWGVCLSKQGEDTQAEAEGVISHNDGCPSESAEAHAEEIEPDGKEYGGESHTLTGTDEVEHNQQQQQNSLTDPADPTSPLPDSPVLDGEDNDKTLFSTSFSRPSEKSKRSNHFSVPRLRTCTKLSNHLSLLLRLCRRIKEAFKRKRP